MDPYPRLSILPVELLQNICSNLPFTSILALSFTCRTLYYACWDRRVFKEYTIRAISLPRYHHLPALDEIDVEDWELESCASEASAEKSELRNGGLSLRRKKRTKKMNGIWRIGALMLSAK
jgi:hypothetical protein